MFWQLCKTDTTPIFQSWLFWFTSRKYEKSRRRNTVNAIDRVPNPKWFPTPYVSALHGVWNVLGPVPGQCTMCPGWVVWDWAGALPLCSDWTQNRGRVFNFTIQPGDLVHTAFSGRTVSCVCAFVWQRFMYLHRKTLQTSYWQTLGSWIAFPKQRLAVWMRNALLVQLPIKKELRQEEMH